MTLPDNMKLILQLNILFSSQDKFLHYLQFLFGSSFNSPGIMNDEVTARERKLIFNVVFSTLINHQKKLLKDFGPLNLSRWVEDISGQVDSVSRSIGNICRRFFLPSKNLRQREVERP